MKQAGPLSGFVNDGADRAVSRGAAQLFVAAAIGAALVRALLEVLFVFRVDGAGLSVEHIVDFAAYYLAIGMSFACLLRRIGQLSWDAALGVCALGYGLAALPPPVDVLWYGLGEFRYLYGSEVPLERWFLVDAQAMPLGEMTALLLVALGASVAVWLVRRSVVRAVVTLLLGLVMVAWHVYGLPACGRLLGSVTMPVGGGGMITLVQIAWFILVRSLCTSSHRKYLLQRAPHILPWGLALTVSAALAGGQTLMVAPLAACACFIFLCLVIENDLCDLAEDAHSDWVRPYGALDHLLSRCGSLIMLVVLWEALDVAGLALSIFYLTGVLYSLPPLRLKARPFPTMYLLEGVWGAMVVLAGVEFSTRGLAHDLAVMLVVAAGFTVVSMVKDRKDVEGDRAEGIPSIYCVLESRGWGLARINQLVGGLAAGSLLVGCGLLVFDGVGGLWGLIIAVLGALASGWAIWKIEDGRRATSLSLVAVNVCLLGAAMAAAGA